MKKYALIEEKSLKSKLLSILTSALMVVTTIVPTLPINSVYAEDGMVNNLNSGITDNDGCSIGSLSEATLLAGDGNPLITGVTTAKDVIANADKTYLLGIASQFCVFLENDFTPKNADAEGRVAVGGNAKFTGGYNYQIGSGDYASATALKNTDNYVGVSNFAHLIVQGNVININTLSQKHDNSYYSKDDDLYKRIVINKVINAQNMQSKDSYSHYTWSGGDGREIYGTHTHDSIYVNEMAQFYSAELINFNQEFGKLSNTSSKLVKISTNGTATWNDKTLTLTCNNPDAKVVYFNLDSWNNELDTIDYVDIPNDAYMIVTYNGEEVSIGKTTNQILTTINGTQISNDSKIGNASNNNKNSERILYNFPNANKVYISANFNGTILSPNADVTSAEGCEGQPFRFFDSKVF